MTSMLITAPWLGRGRLASRALSSAVGDVLLSHDAASNFTTLVLNNPVKHNAFSDVTIRSLTEALEKVPSSSRGLFVKSVGKSFCAGGDVAYMRKLAGASRADNEKDALGLAKLLRMLHDMPMPTIALVQGPAYGGGVGIIAACDIGISVKQAVFALSEVKLGLIPATISPYVVGRMGPHHAKRYFMTAEVMDAARAFHVGLVDELVESEADLNAWEDKLKHTLKQNAPIAVKQCKSLVALVAHQPMSDALTKNTANLLAERRASPEGVEGVGAFLEKRAPAWRL